MERESAAALELREISPGHGLFSYRGAVSLEKNEKGVKPWRIPHRQGRWFFPLGGVGRAAMPSGVRVCFLTDSTMVRLHYLGTPVPPGIAESALLDLRVDGVLSRTFALRTSGSEDIIEMEIPPGGMRLVELWLPLFNQIELRSLQVDEGSTVLPDERVMRRWVHYGSSISQGRGAASPSRTWLAMAAQTLSLDLTSVAMGAGCHLQPLYAGLIRDLGPDLVTCCVGINNHCTGSLNPDSYQPNLLGFIRIIREAHPTVPIVVMSSIFAPRHEDTANSAGMTLRDYRDHTRKAVEILRESGDRRLHYIHGLRLLRRTEESLLLPFEEDKLHLTPDGHQTVAERFITILQNILGKYEESDTWKQYRPSSSPEPADAAPGS